MKGTRLGAVLVAGVLVLAVPSVAHAGNTRVVVAGPENDAIAGRLQKELTALGYQPLRVDDAASCAGPSVIAWMAEMHASGATCSDGTTVVVYSTGPSGVHVADVVVPRGTDESESDTVAMRAAEVARASIELAPSEPDPPSAAAAPTWSSAVPPQVDAGLRDKKRSDAAPYTPSLAFGGGLSALMGADASAPALDLAMDIRVHRRFAIATRGTIALSSTVVTNRNTAVEISPGLFGVGGMVPFAASDSFFIPRLGGGVGVVWLNAQNVFTGAASTGTSFGGVSTTPTHDNILSPAAYLNAAISMRIMGPVRVVVDGLLGTTAHRMVVRADGDHLAYWGQPFGALALRGEVMLK